jgi:hypothetical protein
MKPPVRSSAEPLKVDTMGEAKGYFHRLEKLAKLVLESVKGAAKT